MQLKYVGAKPSVSAKGVSFDQSKPDRYTFLNAAVELLEALDSAEIVERKVDLRGMEPKIYRPDELLDLLKKYCKNVNEIFENREEKTNELIDKYRLRVKNNVNITEDERRAWLGNIDIMRDYYLQYVTNERAYECALNALADKIHELHINEIIFSLGNNYGLVFSHLIPVLTDHKPPYDAEFIWEQRDNETVGKIDMHRPAPIDI
ncbi:hypothetical protein [Sulfurovum riftiae]|uniref:Uncharacterized protein n=1 Tax=Sulfurovum riftiae TaxID=1630136 RepID=A0A151CFQ0_9BACT|nr:hypothetical protein [Sulfurovum riftiae]KYJ86358.1 hypothetical protein AS592_06070 [Sulfurovum riftiae]